ncbi:MAG: type IIL restriction-modification enzyme MmeI [Verrucomicrobiota bacterium]
MAASSSVSTVPCGATISQATEGGKLPSFLRCRAAQAVLDARARYMPPAGRATLAGLYDPGLMTADLLQAHQRLDRAVDRCYGVQDIQGDPFM